MSNCFIVSTSPLYIHPFMDTGYFCILAIVTSATMIMTVDLSDILIYFSLDIDTMGGLLDHGVILFFEELLCCFT